MKPVKSSTIKAIGHDPILKLLYVEFANGGTYRYEDVSADDFAAFESAESAGKHHHSHIRGKFKHSKLEPEKSDSEEKS